jgi:N-methylhydantoinase B
MARRRRACGAPTASWPPEALLQLRTDRVVFEPYGLGGGAPGGPVAELHRDRQPPRAAARQGDHDRAARCASSSTSRPGRRLRRSRSRDPALVREDLLDGKISKAFAERYYGVKSDT